MDAFIGKHRGWKCLYNVFFLFLMILTLLVMCVARIYATKAMGGEVMQSVLWPFGVFTSSNMTRTARSQILTSIAGPLAISPLLIIWYFIWSASNGSCNYKFLGVDDSWKSCFWPNTCSKAFSYCCFLIGVNIFVPAYPLNGAHILVALCAKTCAPKLSTMAMVCIVMSFLTFGAFAALAIMWHDWLSVLFCLFLLYEMYVLNHFRKSNNLQHHNLFRDVYSQSTEKPDDKYTAPNLIDAEEEPVQWGPTEFISEKKKEEPKSSYDYDPHERAYGGANGFQPSSVDDNPFDMPTTQDSDPFGHGSKSGSKDPYSASSSVDPFASGPNTADDPFAPGPNTSHGTATTNPTPAVQKNPEPAKPSTDKFGGWGDSAYDSHGAY